MAFYKEIISALGQNLKDYNVGVWALFRDQMAADISSQYVFGGGRKPDETLLGHSIPYIQEANRIVRGTQKVTGKPSPDFTYYTSEGPTDSLNHKPILVEPATDTLKGGEHKFKGGVSPIRYDKNWISEEYTEGKDSTTPTESSLDKVAYENISNRDTKTLVGKTREWFKGISKDYISQRFGSLISRFSSGFNNITEEEMNNTVGLQAHSKKYGLSRGRNLLRESGTKEYNGYPDPYCRVWTWHHQYHRFVKDTMRPFVDSEGNPMSENELEESKNWKIFRTNADENGNFESGGNRLRQYGVMYDNGRNTTGLVNITPSYDKDATTYSDPRNVSVEHCMFSIENLAWKGTFTSYGDELEKYGLSREQKGPLGGRIMWFPPYDLRFNENSNANWQSNEFIGRGEPIYTYANTTRSGTLSFKLLIDHPAILDYWSRRNEPSKGLSDLNVDNVDSKEQELLRFFAGCSVLSAGNVKNPVREEKNTSNPKTSATKTEDKVLRFFVFFPNNYSGAEEVINVNPIYYLLNGLATNLYTNASNSPEVDAKSPSSQYYPSVTTKYFNEGLQQVGGYEMRSNMGVSIVNQYPDSNLITTLTGNINLVTMRGNGASKKTTKQEAGNGWPRQRYCYRTDFSYLEEDLKHDTSYIDMGSSQLNSTGYHTAVSYLKEEYNGTYSLADVFLALEKDNPQQVKEVLQGCVNEENVAIIKDILSKNKVTKVVVDGWASSQGNNPSDSVNERRNKKLATNRKNTVEKWLRSTLGIDKFGGSANVDTDKSYAGLDANELKAKIGRRAKVEIYYGEAQTEDGNQAKETVNPNRTLNGNTTTTAKDTTIIEDETPTTSVTTTTQSNVRYDNEAMFFEKLTKESPFMTKLISERIKNFDPVFHSMSPEGFNARLTFLEQCMRQGPTISSADTGGENANNLAFGRPPVCVLRIGDFYNTKIIITSMTKNYEPLMWDLNQEGIGVMPMIADISINFNFIGGSDLGGPIQRLQNATSFNYYANTGVYDNRAENIHYQDQKPDKFKAYDPFMVD